MPLQDKIVQVQNSVADLEQLYRQVEADGETHAFKEAILQCIAKQPQHTLFLAWAHRLELLPAVEPSEMHNVQYKHWQKAIGISLVLGTLFLLLAGDQPPVPFPNAEQPHFWLGWSPVLVTKHGQLKHWTQLGEVILREEDNNRLAFSQCMCY